MTMLHLFDLEAEHGWVLELLESELEAVTAVVERQLASELSVINRLCLHIEHYRGKMLRPTLVFLGGLAVLEPGDDEGIAAVRDEPHRVLAAVVEMIHTSTLVHDDVLDEATIRRKGTSANQLFGNELAVMLGDYLISNSFHLCSTLMRPELNLALGAVTNTLCAGEVLQLSRRGDFGLDEATYFEIIRRKTASLIAASCELGARLAGAPDEQAAALGRYGEALGMAFQIQDDVLDIVGDQRLVGKSLGLDLDKQKMTLPLIRLLRDATPSERGHFLELVEAGERNRLQELMREHAALEAAREAAASFVASARSELEMLPRNAATRVLQAMATAVTTRQW